MQAVYRAKRGGCDAIAFPRRGNDAPQGAAGRGIVAPSPQENQIVADNA
jgi:hypothetical protein